jgi:hypothetical protein
MLAMSCIAAVPVTVAASVLPAVDVEALAGELAAVGIAVYPAPGAAEPLVAVTEPASPLALLAGQLPLLATELGDGGGIEGAELDRLAPLPEGAAPLSYVVASWLTTYESAATAWARELMGGVDAHDWRHPDVVVFPRLVLVAFVGDVSRAALGDEPSTPAPVGTASGVGASGLQSPRIAAVCGLAGWVDQVIGSIFDALKSDGTLPPIIEFIVNGAVTLAQGVVEGVVDAIMLPLDVIVGAITLVGVVGMISTMIWPWSAALSITDDADHFGHPGEDPRTGELTLTFGETSDLWALVGDCAQQANIELPSGTPAGAAITWLPAANPLLSSVDGDALVGPDETATLRYVTAWEAVPPTPESTLHAGLVVVRARVEMFSSDDIAALVETLVAGLPFGSLLVQLFAPTVASIGAHLADHMYVDAVALLTISYHLTPTTTTAPTTTVPPCPVGSWRSTGYQAAGQIITGGNGIRLTVRPDMSATMDFAGVVIISSPAAEGPVDVVVTMLQTGTVGYQLAGSGPWSVVGVSQGDYEMTAQATVDGVTVQVPPDLIAGLMGPASGGPAAVLRCAGDGTLVVSWLDGQFSYSFQRA